MSVRERVTAIDERFSRRQKLRGGALLALVGVALLAAVAFVPTVPGPLELIVGALGVVLLAVGVIVLGTAGYRRPA